MDIIGFIKKYRCQFCGKKFMKVEDHMHHQLLYHSDNSSYECSNCHEKFPDMDKLKDHVRKLHSYKKGN